MSAPDLSALCQAGMAILALFMPLAIAWGIVRWSMRRPGGPTRD
ncbi:hypothetical protein [Paracidovorax avenae]|nr:hypothetical protein [Paracidovorax avenae]